MRNVCIYIYIIENGVTQINISKYSSYNYRLNVTHNMSLIDIAFQRYIPTTSNNHYSKVLTGLSIFQFAKTGDTLPFSTHYQSIRWEINQPPQKLREVPGDTQAFMRSKRTHTPVLSAPPYPVSISNTSRSIESILHSRNVFKNFMFVGGGSS